MQFIVETTAAASATDLQTKLDTLRGIVRGYGRVLVAFSGGVDSAFLLKIASDELGADCHALTCVSVTMARSEVEDARALGDELGLAERHHVVESNELEQPGFADNPTHRCALCKTELMDVARPLAEQLGVEVIAIGTNIDDLGDFRPGIAAAKERAARMPMVEAGLSKADIRALSRQLGLRTWDKPQLACLSSRFPYGTKITPERLRRVDAFEDGLRALGFRQLRVRFHDAIARLELDGDELPRACEPAMRAQIVALGKRLDFTYVAVDLGGFRSGSLNEGLDEGTQLVTLRRRAS
ncbi:Queuosine synthesis-like protein [Haliangium ochraceum DSM 14365]|uniref:Queuosine synthesis-like protein n=1 Tax=Haliangium ochraceum (strain DSM 14365 / JCM 11303 / SMP-2) TaxID=502025 RepID=D0LKW7_HALO1|nr:Queuosine synthesis-like protein [Haliangium ochraceum DSM 14365]